MENRTIAKTTAKTLATGLRTRADREADTETATWYRYGADALDAIATGLARNTPTADAIADSRLNEAFDKTGLHELLAVGIILGIHNR